MNGHTSREADDIRIDLLLHQRQRLTECLLDRPYDLIIYLERAVVHSDLGYPDLAAGDAYRALLLTDEVLNEGFEYHQSALESLQTRSGDFYPKVLDHGLLSSTPTLSFSKDSGDRTNECIQLAKIASVRCFQVLSLCLLLCGCLKSAHEFCNRGLAVAPENGDLQETMEYIQTVTRRRLKKDDAAITELPDQGLVRREGYPWNSHEPDRFSAESLRLLNEELEQFAPKCAARVSRLPVLLETASDTDKYDIIPTCSQLGLFAKDDILPGEVVLDEYSLLTANNRLKEPVCDACGCDLPPLGSESEAVNCPECLDTVFCSQFCYNQAAELYHPSVCDKDVDSIAKDSEAKEADETLHLLLLARVLALSNHQGVHPLDLKQVKYIWGDFLSSRANRIDLSVNAEPPPQWTLPFSFKYNIETPLHLLEKMDIDIYATLPEHDLWVFNTLYSKFRGTASARKSSRDGRPDVAAVHPYWCLANHDCDPNVTWEWGGRMVLTARTERVARDRPAGIGAGEEILNHYCDITLPVQQRREWAKGSLGGWCMCARCRDESRASR